LEHLTKCSAPGLACVHIKGRILGWTGGTTKTRPTAGEEAYVVGRSRAGKTRTVAVPSHAVLFLKDFAEGAAGDESTYLDAVDHTKNRWTVFENRLVLWRRINNFHGASVNGVESRSECNGPAPVELCRDLPHRNSHLRVVVRYPKDS
jgi:hypothetical protein